MNANITETTLVVSGNRVQCAFFSGPPINAMGTASPWFFSPVVKYSPFTSSTAPAIPGAWSPAGQRANEAYPYAKSQQRADSLSHKKENAYCRRIETIVAEQDGAPAVTLADLSCADRDFQQRNPQTNRTRRKESTPANSRWADRTPDVRNSSSAEILVRSSLAFLITRIRRKQVARQNPPQTSSRSIRVSARQHLSTLPYCP